MTDLSDAEDDLKERLNRGIGRLSALNECTAVVNSALEAGEGLEAVRNWLEQQLEELTVERAVIISEWSDLRAAKHRPEQ